MRGEGGRDDLLAWPRLWAREREEEGWLTGMAKMIGEGREREG